MKSSQNTANEAGQALVEYVLILALVALVAVGVLTQLGSAIGKVFSQVITVLGG